jgi:mono/diheme cytochrome c family protein
MTRQLIFKSILIVVFMGILFAQGFSIPVANPTPGMAPGSSPQLENAKDIFKRNCIKCHGGSRPAQELNLEPEYLVDSTVNVTSLEKTDMKIIDTVHPQNSYLLMKIKGEPTIVGKPMPLKNEPLKDEEIKTLEAWILSLQESTGESGPGLTPKAKPVRNAFWGSRLINLATPTLIPRRHFLFRVTHRFIPSAKEGYDFFYGLDGPAVVYISMGYGISRSLDITLGRSNLFQDWELMLKWRILSPQAGSSFPLAIALHAGGNWVSQHDPGGTIAVADKMKFNLQLSAAYALTPRISLLLVPGYSSHVNHYDPDPEGTFVLGTGLNFKLTGKLAIMGEWVPVFSGYQANANGWAVGFQYKIGKHLFQVFALNSFGITIDQFLPGGDLRLKDGDFRFGFTIYREL